MAMEGWASRTVRRTAKAGVVLLASLLLAASLAVPANAVSLLEPDGNAHPSVAAVIVDFDEFPSDHHGYQTLCTATLVHPRVAVTAAQCVFPLLAQGYPSGDKDIWVSFHSQPIDKPATWQRVTAVVTHPEYQENRAGRSGGMTDSHDIAALVLAKPLEVVASRLAPVDYLDLAVLADAETDALRFLVVGYAGEGESHARRNAFVSFAGLRDAWLQTSQDLKVRDRQSCPGPGAPVFWVDESGMETIVAITSRGDQRCGTDFNYRIDTPAAMAFIREVLSAVDSGHL